MSAVRLALAISSPHRPSSHCPRSLLQLLHGSIVRYHYHILTLWLLPSTLLSFNMITSPLPCLFSLIFFSLASLTIAGSVDPNIWPLPQHFTYGSTRAFLSVNFTIHCNVSNVTAIDTAIARYTPIIFSHSARSQRSPMESMLTSLDILVVNSTAPLQLGMDESYTLTVPAPSESSASVTLAANTLWGAVRGLETFSQLVYFDFNAGRYYIDSAPWSIVDYPRFTHRGVMLDVSRHFHPLASIRALIDSITHAKFNVLHLHLTDMQAFPYHSVSLPALSQAAYSPQEQYSYTDIADIVQYAAARAVRVVIETDMPGHASSWCAGYPGLCPTMNCTSPLDPSNELTFTVIESLMRELTSVAPDTLFHVGGDEVNTDCWNNTAHVREWMAQRGFNLTEALWYFTSRVQNITMSLGRTPVAWDEVYDAFTTRMPRESIVHVWRLTQLHINATNDGYRALLSVCVPWYLDSTSFTWQMMYGTDPWDGIQDEAKRRLVLGGETALWSEEVDAGVLLNSVWPRAAAVAEKLWSAWEVDDVLAAEPRYAWFRCLLNTRGVGAAPWSNQFSRSAPPAPGACLDQ